MRYGNSYHYSGHTDVGLTIRLAVDALKDLEFDTIAFQGISGALIAPIVAYMMDKSIVAIRKNCDCDAGLHMGKLVGHINGDYVIIDDLIDYGRTAGRIMAAIRQAEAAVKCVGIYTYRPNLRCDQEVAEQRIANLGIKHYFYENGILTTLGNKHEVPAPSLVAADDDISF